MHLAELKMGDQSDTKDRVINSKLNKIDEGSISSTTSHTSFMQEMIKDII